MAHLQFRWLLIGAAAWLIAQPFDMARATTQALALLETSGPTPLNCADGVCRAEFSTFCLRKERPLPETRASYTVATDENLHLLLTTPDGAVRRVPAADHVRIYSARGGYTAIVIELPRSTLEALGARRAAVDVGEGVTLMPVAIARDDDPQTEQEKLLATGPLRVLGARLIDRSPDAVATVRVLNPAGKCPAAAQRHRTGCPHAALATRRNTKFRRRTGRKKSPARCENTSLAGAI